MVDISKEPLSSIQTTIDYWISYLHQYNITTTLPPNNNNNKTTSIAEGSRENRIAILLVGTQKDKLSSSSSSSPSPQQRLREIESLFTTYQQKGFVNDYCIVSGKKIQGIRPLIERIQHYGEQIVNSESLFLPTTAAQIATIIQEKQEEHIFPLLLSKQELEQYPTIRPLGNLIGIELALSLLHNIGTLVYQPTTK